MPVLIDPGGGLSIPSVSVTPDPGLMSADPSAMAAASQAFGAGAKQLYQVFQTAGTAGNVLLGTWQGKGADAFQSASDTTMQNAQTSAEALMGASMALSALSRAVAAAQAKARQALALADTVNREGPALANSFAASRAHAIASLPAHATGVEIEAASQPTGAQTAQASALAADAALATKLMGEANTEARMAWRAAKSAFDEVTAQSPTVQNDLLNARIKAFNQTMDNAGIAIIGLAMVGAAEGGPGGDDGEEGDDGDVGVGGTDSAIASSELQAEEKVAIDGEKLDPTIVGDANAASQTTVDAEQGALGGTGGGPADGGATGIVPADVGDKVSPQAQGRHVMGAPQYTQPKGYFNSQGDAQQVLDDFHNGNLVVLGRTSSGAILVQDENVTGYNVNAGQNIYDQPTHVFMIKGTRKVSVVPMSPTAQPAS